MREGTTDEKMVASRAIISYEQSQRRMVWGAVGVGVQRPAIIRHTAALTFSLNLDRCSASLVCKMLFKPKQPHRKINPTCCNYCSFRSLSTYKALRSHTTKHAFCVTQFDHRPSTIWRSLAYEYAPDIHWALAVPS